MGSLRTVLCSVSLLTGSEELRAYQMIILEYYKLRGIETQAVMPYSAEGVTG